VRISEDVQANKLMHSMLNDEVATNEIPKRAQSSYTNL